MQVRDMRVGLALVRCAPPGHWEAELAKQDSVRPEEFADAAEAAGGALDRSGHYPLTPQIRRTPCAPLSTYKKEEQEKARDASPLTPVLPVPSEEVLVAHATIGASSRAATPGVVDERTGKPRGFSRRPWACKMLGN